MIAIICTPHEETTKKEIDELLKGNILHAENGKIYVETSVEKAAQFIYNARSISGATLLLQQGNITSKKDFSALSLPNFSEYIKGKTFAVRCRREGEHDFTSQEVERELGKRIEGEVNLSSPDVTILIDINEEKYDLGIDLVGFNLARRDYRVKVAPVSLNPCIAYALLRIVDWNPKKVLLDPYSKEGTIIIEAALYGLNISPFVNEKQKFSFHKILNVRLEDHKKEKELSIHAFSNSFNYIRNAELNAKLAGVQKHIKLSRNDLDWLDTKFEKNSVDCIVSFLQFMRTDEKEKIIKEVIYQTEYILKGKAVFLVKEKDLVEKYAEEFKLKFFRQEIITTNGQDFWILGLEK